MQNNNALLFRPHIMLKSMCVWRQAFSTMGAPPLSLGRQPPWNSHLLGKLKCSKFNFLRRKSGPSYFAESQTKPIY